MTILTKTSDKKKLLPINVAVPVTAAPSAPAADEESQVAYARHRARTATLLVCLLGVLVLMTGVLAGVCFYRQYLREKVQRLNFFMPYEPENINSHDNVLLNSNWRDGPTYADALNSENDDDDEVEDLNSLHNFMAQLMAQFNRDMEDPVKEIRRMETNFSPFDSDEFRKKFFREEVEIKDDSDDSYADIKIPDFRDGRRGRFIHDYKNNQTTIIDEDARRCFVYPLDYATTLPPKSMIDVIIKMRTGYYFPDTNVLRKEMRVVTPALDLDDEYISARTRLTCSDMSIYRLEPIVRGVYKRSIPEINDHGKFAEYSGKGIVEVNIVNIGEI